MTIDAATIAPRSQISLGVVPAFRGSIAQFASGRVVVIDYFASRRCSIVIGDLPVDFEVTPPGRGYVELASIKSVRVFAASRLLGILDAGSSLRLGGPPFARHLAVDLDRPERWIDFLEAPEVLAGKRRFAWRRR